MCVVQFVCDNPVEWESDGGGGANLEDIPIIVINVCCASVWLRGADKTRSVAFRAMRL